MTTVRSPLSLRTAATAGAACLLLLALAAGCNGQASASTEPDGSATADAGRGGGPDASGPAADAGPGPDSDGGSTEPCAEGEERGPEGECRAVDVLRSSITQYGITWTFEGEQRTGQFVTGDYWVVGPVRIVEVDPAPTGDRHGSMLDPVGPQAYDSRAGRYEADRAVAFPLTVEPGHSLVSSISHPDEPQCTQGSADGWRTYDGSCQRGPIDTQAVLTVLAEAPPADAFRPAYSAHAPTLYRASDICWERLPSLEPPESVPDVEALLRHVQRPWIDHLRSWTMQHGCATSNMYCYGREIGDIVSRLSTYLVLDAPRRDELALRMVQLGIDNHGVLRAGGGWGADGGHFNGRKWPVVLAGGLLGDAAMASPGNGVGNEDRMTYYGTDGTALWGRDCDACYFPNGCTYGGSCTRGSKDCRDPEGLTDGCSGYRNCCTSRTWVGEALAARLTGLREAWGHPPFFDYVDRWMEGAVAGGGSSSDGFVDAVWAMHRETAEVTAACP